jgi:hypothetical protein
MGTLVSPAPSHPTFLIMEKIGARTSGKAESCPCSLCLLRKGDWTRAGGKFQNHRLWSFFDGLDFWMRPGAGNSDHGIEAPTPVWYSHLAVEETLLAKGDVGDWGEKESHYFSRVQLCHSLSCPPVPTGKFSLQTWGKRSRGREKSSPRPQGLAQVLPLSKVCSRVLIQVLPLHGSGLFRVLGNVMLSSLGAPVLPQRLPPSPFCFDTCSATSNVIP